MTTTAAATAIDAPTETRTIADPTFTPDDVTDGDSNDDSALTIVNNQQLCRITVQVPKSEFEQYMKQITYTPTWGGIGASTHRRRGDSSGGSSSSSSSSSSSTPIHSRRNYLSQD